MTSKWIPQRRSLQTLALRQSRFHEGIPHPHCPVPASMFKIFRENLWDAMVLSISPEMGVVPWEPIGCHPSQRCAKDRFARIDHRELRHKQFGLASGILARHQRRLPASRSNHGVYELDQRLVSNAKVSRQLSPAQHRACGVTLGQISWVAAVDQNISV